MNEMLWGFSGMRIVQHSLAVTVRDEWKVERHPIKKKRRQWRVAKHRITTPSCYQVGDTLYMHPELVERLRQVG